MSKYNFKQKLKKLEDIVYQLENNQDDLEKMVTLYKQGTKLSKELYEKLNNLEAKIEIINREKDE